MSNKGVPLSKSKRTPQKETKTPQQKSLIGRIIRSAWSGVLIVAALLAYLVLIPRPAVDFSDPEDPADPFSSSVTISNTGYISLDSVMYGVAISSIDLPVGGGMASNSPYGAVLVPDSSSHNPQNLGLDGKFSFPLNDVIKADKENLNGADIGVLVVYQIPILHWERQKLFPMQARQQSNGNFYWYHKSPPENTKQTVFYRISSPIQLRLHGTQIPPPTK